ncbi:unnamed protein product, partial [marine sediment metagenome]
GIFTFSTLEAAQAELGEHIHRIHPEMTIYHQVLDTISKKSQWENGESVRLQNGKIRGKPGMVYLKNTGSGYVMLHLWQKGRRSYTSPGLRVAHLSGANGWQTSVDFDAWAYRVWHRRVSSDLEKN